ncbi:MAG TPA: DNA replication/repair protein RecF [Steroidobacteraceae bacterium]|nr:DNA replication/repair protein RecF [Steroidobacteraceae bacterium]
MSLGALSIQNLRCLRQVDLELHPGRNLIIGANGSGKTSLLEAVFLLGRGRSFRTRNSERLISHGESRLVVFGRTLPPDASGIPTALGIQVTRGEPTIAKVQGAFTQTLADLSAALPVQVIDPGVHKLVEDSAYRRRRWMDWATFHVEHGFVEVWANYTRALKQRNAVLKQIQTDRGATGQLDAWDSELAQLGEKLAQSRRRVLEDLRPHWQATVLALADLNLELVYFQGWGRGTPLLESLQAFRERDVQRGSTHAGPHRADVILKLDGKLARDTLSRGQQKLAAVSMILAQLRLLTTLLPEPPTLLLDDPAAELDPERLTRFIDQVAPLRSQLVLTSLTAGGQPFGQPDRVFHVEQGRVSEG